MSAEAFLTPLSCDIRTAPDGQSAEYAEAFTGQPRSIENGRFTEHRNGWAACVMYAEDVVRLAARAVREQPMEGITGDHPDKREGAAVLLDAVASLVRFMALDHADDGELTHERWIDGLHQIRRQVDRMEGGW